MSTTRRSFLVQTGLLGAAALTGCTRDGRAAAKKQAAPAFHARAHRVVERVFTGMPTRDGAGVQLERVIGQRGLRNLDPFLMLDRFHSDDPRAYIAGFPNHPHRGFETVTVMLAGRMRHGDSMGNSGLIGGGGAQWMTAARGIIHSEFPEQEQGLMSGFQLWINLPAAEKMGPVAYQDLQPDQLTEGRLTASGSLMRVIAGEAQGLKGPVRERPTQPLLFTAVLADDQPLEIDLPTGHTAFAFVSSGEVAMGPENAARTIHEGQLAILGAGNRFRAQATSRRSEILFAAGRPLNEPIVQRGPFVMNTETEIRKAFEDYRNGVLDKG